MIWLNFHDFILNSLREIEFSLKKLIFFDFTGVDVGTGVSTGGGTGGRACDKNRIKKDVGSEFESDAGGLSQNAGLMNFLQSLASALNSNSRSGFESRIPEAGSCEKLE